jgi:hypothetical protein
VRSSAAGRAWRHDVSILVAGGLVIAQRGFDFRCGLGLGSVWRWRCIYMGENEFDELSTSILAACDLVLSANQTPKSP